MDFKNEDVFDKHFDMWLNDPDCDGSSEGERNSKMAILEALEPALRDPRQAGFLGKLRKGWKDASRQKSNMVFFTDISQADNFSKLLDSAEARSLAGHFARLFDERTPLPTRIDSFRGAVKSAMEALPAINSERPKPRTISIGLISFFLAARSQTDYSIYKHTSLLAAYKNWGIPKPPPAALAGARYAAWQALVREIALRIEHRRGSPSDLHESYYFLWYFPGYKNIPPKKKRKDERHGASALGSGGQAQEVASADPEADPPNPPKGTASSRKKPPQGAERQPVLEKELDKIGDSLADEGGFTLDSPEGEREKRLRSIAARRGQPAFRKKLLRAYGKRCALTGCDAPEALEAAHIDPYRSQDSHHVQNGILLRADLHTLFDRGLLGFVYKGQRLTPVLHRSLSKTTYARLSKTARLPDEPGHRPSAEALAQHLDRHGLRG